MNEQINKQELKRFFDMERQGHRGECRGFPNCFECYFFKKLYNEFSIDQNYGDDDYPTDKHDLMNRPKVMA